MRRTRAPAAGPTTRSLVRRRALPLASVLLSALLLVLAALTTDPPAPAHASAIVPATRQVASATAGDFRATFTATMRPDDGSGMPVADVQVAGFVRRSGRWTPIGTRPVPGVWFWNVVTDTGGVCDLTIGTRPRAHAAITLDGSGSLGCGAAAAFHVEGGRLESG